MVNPLVLKQKCVFHITHIKNLPKIVKDGLLCRNLAQSQKVQYENISDAGIQVVRSIICVPQGSSHTLHDYVPTFFGARPPMLYAIRFKGIQQEEIVYILINWDVISLPTTYFTDGNARTQGTKFFCDPSDLTQVDFDTAAAQYWGDKGDEYKRRKQAEVLVFQKINLVDIKGFAVYNEAAKLKVEKILQAQKVSKPIYITPEYYF